MMREEEMETSMKVVIVGNGAIGKSSMIQRYCKGIFMKDYKKTIGVDFLERVIEINGEDVRLMLWDTAGQEEFDAITKAYYRGAQACVLVFSTTDMDSFHAIQNWKRKVEDEVGGIIMVLVQNKIDLLEMAAIEKTEVNRLASDLCLPLFMTSVKDDIRVEDVFTYLASRYVEQMDQIEEEPNKVRAIRESEVNYIPPPNEKQQKKQKPHWLTRSRSREDIIDIKPTKRRTTNTSMAVKCRI